MFRYLLHELFLDLNPCAINAKDKIKKKPNSLAMSFSSFIIQDFIYIQAQTNYFCIKVIINIILLLVSFWCNC